MIGTATYTLTSFEIIIGGIFMYAMGVISTVALLIYYMWKICNKVESKKNSDNISEQDYTVE